MARAKASSAAVATQKHPPPQPTPEPSQNNEVVDPPDLRNTQTVVVTGSRLLNGNWILRKYSNDGAFERIDLDRVEEDHQPAAAKKPPNTADVIKKQVANLVSAFTGCDTTGLTETNGVPTEQSPTLGQPRRQTLAQEPQQHSHFYNALEPLTRADRKIVMKAGEGGGGGLFDPGDPGQRKFYNSSQSKFDDTEPSEHFQGQWISGWNQPQPEEEGTWFFKTTGEGSSKEHARTNLGRDCFDPPTNSPTAQDVVNYRRYQEVCLKPGDPGFDLTKGIDLVWRPKEMGGTYSERRGADNAVKPVPEKEQQTVQPSIEGLSETLAAKMMPPPLTRPQKRQSSRAPAPQKKSTTSPYASDEPRPEPTKLLSPGSLDEGSRWGSMEMLFRRQSEPPVTRRTSLESRLEARLPRNSEGVQDSDSEPTAVGPPNVSWDNSNAAPGSFQTPLQIMSDSEKGNVFAGGSR